MCVNPLSATRYEILPAIKPEKKTNKTNKRIDYEGPTIFSVFPVLYYHFLFLSLSLSFSLLLSLRIFLSHTIIFQVRFLIKYTWCNQWNVGYFYRSKPGKLAYPPCPLYGGMWELVSSICRCWSTRPTRRLHDIFKHLHRSWFNLTDLIILERQLFETRFNIKCFWTATAAQWTPFLLAKNRPPSNGSSELSRDSFGAV